MWLFIWCVTWCMELRSSLGWCTKDGVPQDSWMDGSLLPAPTPSINGWGNSVAPSFHDSGLAHAWLLYSSYLKRGQEHFCTSSGGLVMCLTAWAYPPSWEWEPISFSDIFAITSLELLKSHHFGEPTLGLILIQPDHFLPQGPPNFHFPLHSQPSNPPYNLCIVD